MPVLDPVNSAVDRVRLAIADIGDLPYLTNEVIAYYITKNENNERAATIECANVILGILSVNSGYHKVDVLIQDSTKTVKAYKDFLLTLINPRLGGGAAQVYAGGISKQDMLDNVNNADNNTRPSLSDDIFI